MVEESKSDRHPILRWGALAFGTLIWGSGVAAMYGDDYKLAGALYFIGIATCLLTSLLSYANTGAIDGEKAYP